MSIPKNHHFVPQGYLKRLVKPDTQVHYAWKESRIISSTSAKRLCSEIDGYKLVSVAPEDALLLDTTYKNLWEDYYDEVYRRLVDDSTVIINDRLRQLVVGTICSLLFRSQRMLNAVDGLMRQSIAFMANARALDGSQPKVAELDGKMYQLEGKRRMSYGRNTWQTRTMMAYWCSSSSQECDSNSCGLATQFALRGSMGQLVSYPLTIQRGYTIRLTWVS